MSENGPTLNVVPAGGPQSVAAWEDRPSSVSAIPRPSFERPLAAVRRYKWLMLGVLLLAIPGGIVATRLVTPQYEVRATIWIEPDSRGQSASGPIRPQEMLASTAWVELLRSYRIVDAVVRKLALYVRPDKTADFPLFSSFDIADRFVPGSYELNVDPAKKRWTLSRPDGAFPDSGGMTDSVGRQAGLRWVVPASLFEGAAK